ncbi:hypothetical protein DLAC_06724 [Tieghemostelium lacteum]|uniref:UspA domain-containing protein n=1 Tax=Tieghemostelium lacteum TaxID=361077 RepID=A0A151ZFS5_TIELA|nr:hypothetical protein DLAC_06724 [Tieghemostelium lacteum]|eukprot:KYQ92720.1 hypothetical protein DLAC_06724 [Tieghemostelium lacteum]
MNRYMICLDGSTESERAFRWLESIALSDPTKDIEVYLLHVIDDKFINKIDGKEDNAKRKELGKKGVESYSIELTNNHIKNYPIIVETIHNIKDSILHQIQKNRIEMIVVGHQEKGRIKRLLDGHGSVSDFLLKNSNIPILIFR